MAAFPTLCCGCRSPVLAQIPSDEFMAVPKTSKDRTCDERGTKIIAWSLTMTSRSAVGVDPSPYLSAIRKFSLLSLDEERALASRWRDRQDVDAAHRLVTSHLGLVVKIAKGYAGYGLPIADLVSEGNIGLMLAVRRFDPGRGVRLSTYAMWWIRAGIQNYILHSWSLVKIGTTAAQKKLFFNLRRLKSQMRAFDNGDLKSEQVAEIARKLDVPAQDVIGINRRLAGSDHSLNNPLRSDGEGQGGDGQWQDLLADETESHENAIADREELTRRKALLSEALTVLNERERHIIVERRLRDEPMSCEELSRQYGISHQRVHQIERRALEKLRTTVTNHPMPMPFGSLAGTSLQSLQ
jgi:RNA polymerase sigma-32 factor